MEFTNREKELLKNNVCLQPFRHIEMFKDNATLCCPTWLKKPLWYHRDKNGNFDYDVWNRDDAQDIRKSILDGSYKYCDTKICPHLNTLLTTGKNTGMFLSRDEETFPFEDLDGIVINDEVKIRRTPGSINFTFDNSCNLKCPSCRLETIMARPEQVKEIDKIVNFINKNYSNDCRKIVITGSGDPFASKSFRKFLFEFEPNQWPNLKTVYLVSNGKLFNKQNWESMKKIQPYITDVEISIDAGTKETYENKTRIGGDWDILIENLKYISKIKTIKSLRISFIVQVDNYNEMTKCADLICDIFEERLKQDKSETQTTLYFGKIDKWNHMTDDDMIKKDVGNPSHPNHLDFKEKLKEVYTYNDRLYIQSNLTYLLN